MAGIIWLGSSVQHVNNCQRISCLPFLISCKSRIFLETKTYFFISIKKKSICKKKSKIFGANMVCTSICPKLSSILLPFSFKVNHSLTYVEKTVQQIGHYIFDRTNYICNSCYVHTVILFDKFIIHIKFWTNCLAD